MGYFKVKSKIIILFFGVLSIGACNSKNDSPDISDSSHIKYFGFTIVDTYWDDPSDNETKTNYSDEVAPFSNMADILVLDPATTIVGKMEVMNGLQMKSILHLYELFFEADGTDAPSGTNYRLRTNAQERWNVFMTTNALNENQGLVQAFYIGEEPTWNGISFTELQQATDYVKSSLPNIPILVIEAYLALGDLQVPASVDWVGFDHYFIKDPKNDATYTSELNLLKSKLTPEQKLVVVLDAHYIDFAHGDHGGVALNEMGEVALSYYDLAKSEPRTIALLGYFWPSGFDSDNSIGARNMPDVVKNKYISIGKEITRK